MEQVTVSQHQDLLRENSPRMKEATEVKRNDRILLRLHLDLCCVEPKNHSYHKETNLFTFPFTGIN